MSTNGTTQTQEVTTKYLRLKSNVVNKIEDIANEENRSFNNMVETILMNYSKTR